MRVGLFVTCLVDMMRPSIGFSTLRLLQAAGCDVVVPTNQTCCGQPGYNVGDSQAAKILALKFLEEFKDCDYVVVPSGSCAGMIRVHYPALFKDDLAFTDVHRRVTERTHELTDFLANIVKLKKIPGSYCGSLTYHDSCSGLRELGVQAQPRALLAQMPGVKLAEMHEASACCGFGGSFSVKFGDISARMADKKCQHAGQTGADAIVAGDLGCLMNIEGRLRRRGDLHTRVWHIAEVLAGEDAACK